MVIMGIYNPINSLVPSFPFSETCFLFSSCEDVLECTECVIESKTCEVTFKGQDDDERHSDEEEFCSSPLEGTLGQNILEFLPDVATEAECLQACEANQDCVFYTHHRELM